MPDRIILPDCLMHAYRQMFPKMDFSRIGFFDGIPSPFNINNSAITLTTGADDINIYLQQGTYDPGSLTTFTTLAHELVHALQIEQLLPRLPFSNIWISRYVACTITGFSTDNSGGNALENEAYAFEAAVTNAVWPPPQTGNPILPCTPVNDVPWLVSNPNFDTLLAQHPEIIKADASDDTCYIPGPLKGTLIQAIWGLIALGIGIIANIVYSIIDGIVTIVQKIGSFISSVFSHDQTGHLNLLFSTDNARSFDQKITFESSTEQPALALGQNRLFIGWTGTDRRLNILAEPGNVKTTIQHEKSNDCGPALAWDGQRLYLAWQGTDNRLNIVSSPNGQTFQNKVILNERSPNDATPGLAFGNGFLYLAWIGKDHRLNLLASRDGVNWLSNTKLTLKDTSGDNNTAALAFANGRLYLAWVGRDNRHWLNVMSLFPSANGTLQQGVKMILNDTSTDNAGPALATIPASPIPIPIPIGVEVRNEESNKSNEDAASAAGDLLLLSWIGRDSHNSVNTMSSSDGQSFSGKVVFERSNDHTGPALAAQVGLVCVGWVGKV